MNILKISTLSRLILHYGLFAAIAHAAAILLYARISPPLPPITSFIRYFPMIEHSLMSFVCVLLGALLCFYIAKNEN